MDPQKIHHLCFLLVHRTEIGHKLLSVMARSTSSMSGSFQPPGPAKRARPTVLSKLFRMSDQVAFTAMLMSWLVRQVLAICSRCSASATHARHDWVFCHTKWNEEPSCSSSSSVISSMGKALARPVCV